MTPVLALLLLGPLVGPQESGEKELLRQYEASLRGADAETEVVALDVLASASRTLEDGGASKALSRVLAAPLREDADEADLSLWGAALEAVAWGREPAVVIEAVGEALDGLRGEVDRLNTRPDEESRQRLADVRDLHHAASAVLAVHPDDRSVEVLLDQMNRLSRVTGEVKAGQSPAALLVQPVAEALLALGSRDAVEAVVKQTATYVGAHQKLPGLYVHAALAQWLAARGGSAPAFSDSFDQFWRDWWDEHEGEFPAELGTLEGPTGKPARPAEKEPKAGR